MSSISTYIEVASQNGEFVMLDSNRIKSFLGERKGKRLRLIIEDMRSLSQEAYWRFLMTEISDHTGLTPKESDELFTNLYLVEFMLENIPEPLTVEQFSRKIEFTKRIAAQNLGIYLPDAGE